MSSGMTFDQYYDRIDYLLHLAQKIEQNNVQIERALKRASKPDALVIYNIIKSAKLDSGIGRRQLHRAERIIRLLNKK